MDVRERLETPSARPVAERDAGLELFRRGRRRLWRRRAVTSGGALAALVVGVLAWPGGMPAGDQIVVDDVVGAPDSTDPDGGSDPEQGSDSDRGAVSDGGSSPGAEPGPEEGKDPGSDGIDPADSDTLDAPEQIIMGGVRLTVPAGVQLRSRDTPVPIPCHPGTTAPTVHLLAAGIDPDIPDCEGETATATSIVVAPSSQMPPAYLPGEGIPDEELDVTEIELLGTTGTSEAYEQRDGTEVISYVFGEFDLYLAVRGPDLTPDLVDALLGSAERRGGDDDGSGSPAPSATDEELIARFLQFASDPSAATAAELPFGDEVALGLADDLLVTRTRPRLADPTTWELDVEHFRGYAGPFSALELAAGSNPTDTVVSLGEHPHCASPPQPPPAELDGHRRVSVQPDPDTYDSCLNWWTVDFFIAGDDTVAAATLDLYEP